MTSEETTGPAGGDVDADPGSGPGFGFGEGGDGGGPLARGLSPADTPAGAATRFLVELAAWGLGAAAAWQQGGWLLGLVVLAALVALPATFNARGDKAHEGVVVPGPVRQLIEALLGAVAVVSAAIVWGLPGALLLVGLVAVAAVAGRRRSVWLVGNR